MRHLRCRFSRREASNQQHFLLTQNTLTNPAAVAAAHNELKSLQKTAISSKFSPWLWLFTFLFVVSFWHIFPHVCAGRKSAQNESVHDITKAKVLPCFSFLHYFSQISPFYCTFLYFNGTVQLESPNTQSHKILISICNKFQCKWSFTNVQK